MSAGRGGVYFDKYGPWAVVTGASDGIGRECARELAARGFSLVLAARRRGVLEELAADLHQEHGVEAVAVEVDLTQPAGIDVLLRAADTRDVGLLVAAAGFGTSGPLIEGDLKEELEMVDVNCRAVLALSYAFAHRFTEQRRGGIVLMSSLLAFQGVPRAANYAATKAYVQVLAEGLRRELRGAGVDVTASAPGPVHTGFAERAHMRMGMALQPAGVARATLDALGKKTTVRPGWLSKLLEGSLSTLPRFARTRILEAVMGGMTKHQNGGPESENSRPAHGMRA